MAQYGQEQYGTVQYGGGTQAVGTANFDYTASGQVTSNQDRGTATFTFAPSGQVTSAFDSGDGTFSLTATGSGDVVGIAGSGTAEFDFSASGLSTFPVAAAGTEYYLDRTDKSNYIVFNGDESNYPDITIGEENSFTFYIKGTSRFQDAETRYDRVKDLERYAGYPTVERTLSGAYYSEDSYPLSTRDSLLVSIEPGDGVDEARGVWGIVQSIDDSTEIFGAVARIDMSVLVLAEFDDFADRSAVEAEYKADF